MKTLLCAGLLAVGATLAASAAEPTSGPSAEPDPALVDAIVRKLESEGILDRAVERALIRVINRMEEERRAAGGQQQSQARERAKNARKVLPKRDHIRGSPSAEVSLIEYSDFECPFCKRFHPTAKALLDRFGGRVNWVYRHFPLSSHDPAARREAIASECAGQLGGNDAFWKYTDAVFEHTQSNGRGLPPDKSIEALAAQLGLDRAAFSRCLQDPKIAKRVEEDMDDGAAAGVTGTPTTLIRDNRTGAVEIVTGAQHPEVLAARVERLLHGSR
jgi:protein-disulfide isomerase